MSVRGVTGSCGIWKAAILLAEDKVYFVRAPVPRWLTLCGALLAIATLIMMFLDTSPYPMPGLRVLGIPVPVIVMVGFLLFCLWHLAVGCTARRLALAKAEEVITTGAFSEDSGGILARGSSVVAIASEFKSAKWKATSRIFVLTFKRGYMNMKVGQGNEAIAEEIIKCLEGMAPSNQVKS